MHSLATHYTEYACACWYFEVRRVGRVRTFLCFGDFAIYIYIVGREMLPPALDTYLLVPLWLTSISVSILKYEGTVLFGVRIIVGKDI